MEETKQIEPAALPSPMPSIGRIVHYVMPSGKTRPAIVVETWGMGVINAQVFLDGLNDVARAGDTPNDPPRALPAEYPLTKWVTSVSYGVDGVPGTWCYPPRV